MTIDHPDRRTGRRHRRSVGVALALTCLTLTGCPETPGGGSTTTTPGSETTSTVPHTNTPECQALKAAGAADPHRYFSDTAQWNIPASCYETTSDSARWATNWFKYSSRRPTPGDTAREGRLNVSFEDYSVPIYYAEEATGWVEVWGHKYFDPVYVPDTNVYMPWNPAWVPSTGADRDLIIVDRSTGTQWGIWELDVPGVPSLNCTAVAFHHPGEYGPDDLCASSASIARDANGGITDVRVSDGTTVDNIRGMGKVQSLGMLPTVAEVESGTIHHALNFDAYNTLFGPACSSSELNTSAAGNSCGYAVAPATRLEYTEGPGNCGVNTMTVAERPNTVPEGTRFALTLSHDDVDEWLEGKPWSEGKKAVARTFAIALIDYGWIISDTGCGDATIAAEGVGNPATRARWAALGIGPSDGDLLSGLVSSASDVRTLRPPWPTRYTNAQ